MPRISPNSRTVTQEFGLNPNLKVRDWYWSTYCPKTHGKLPVDVDDGQVFIVISMEKRGKKTK